MGSQRSSLKRRGQLLGPSELRRFSQIEAPGLTAAYTSPGERDPTRPPPSGNWLLGEAVLGELFQAQRALGPWCAWLQGSGGILHLQGSEGRSLALLSAGVTGGSRLSPYSFQGLAFRAIHLQHEDHGFPWYD